MSRIPLLVFTYGSLIAFVWEIYQMPFFESEALSAHQLTVRCGVASLGDGLILLAGYVLASLSGGRCWPWKAAPAAYVIYFGFGLVVAILVENIATSLPLSSLFSWRYSDFMPVIPGIGMALIPIAMWIIVPALTLGLLRLGASAKR